MTNKEIIEQLEWSDQCEFSYGYSMWSFKEIERLNNIINELEKCLEGFDFTAYICGNRKASKSIELGARLNNDFILDKLKELKEGNKDE